jgi:hypothetical protein
VANWSVGVAGVMGFGACSDAMEGCDRFSKLGLESVRANLFRRFVKFVPDEVVNLCALNGFLNSLVLLAITDCISVLNSS